MNVSPIKFVSVEYYSGGICVSMDVNSISELHAINRSFL